jgi:hypothetical protein
MMGGARGKKKTRHKRGTNLDQRSNQRRVRPKRPEHWRVFSAAHIFVHDFCHLAKLLSIRAARTRIEFQAREETISYLYAIY